nr:hypothetical protein pPsy0462a_00079 [Pseudomonas syringae]
MPSSRLIQPLAPPNTRSGWPCRLTIVNKRLSAGRLADGRAAIAWNKEEKLWFARPGCDLDRITAWLPDPSRRAGGGDAESEFLDVLTQAGLVVKGMPVMDGSRQRVATVDDKHGKKSGVYCGFLDRRPAGWFINYHRADSPKDVTNWAATGGESDPITRVHIRAGAKQAQEDAARDRAATYAKQTLAAKRLYDRLPAADPAHPYLVRKGIPPTPDIRQTRNGALVVPFLMPRERSKRCNTSLPRERSCSSRMPPNKSISWWWAARSIRPNPSCMPRAMPRRAA